MKLLVLVLIGGTTCLAAGSYALFSSITDRTGANVVAPNSPRSVVIPTQDLWKGQRPTAALITITPRGFEPASLTLPAGRTLLMVDNRSGFRGEIKLRLTLDVKGRREPLLLKRDVRDTGAGQPEVSLTREKLNWRNLVDLVPGQYLLTEAGHPLWVCRITVTDP